MTDIQTLTRFRLEQARETLRDAEKMLLGDFSQRSIVNRAYYTMFYAVLALHLRFETPLRTSKHAGVIAFFDTMFVRTGKLDARFSRMLHGIFELRQEGDYKVRETISEADAGDAVRKATELLQAVEALIRHADESKT